MRQNNVFRWSIIRWLRWRTGRRMNKNINKCSECNQSLDKVKDRGICCVNSGCIKYNIIIKKQWQYIV